MWLDMHPFPFQGHHRVLGLERGARDTPVEVLAGVLNAELCLLHPSCIGASAALSPNNLVSVSEPVRDGVTKLDAPLTSCIWSSRQGV